MRPSGAALPGGRYDQVGDFDKAVSRRKKMEQVGIRLIRATGCFWVNANSRRGRYQPEAVSLEGLETTQRLAASMKLGSMRSLLFTSRSLVVAN